MEKGQANFDPTGDWKTRCGCHFRAHTAISTLSNHSLYLYNEMLEGLRCCEILESIRKHTILVWKVGYWSRICHPPITQSGCMVIVIHDDLRSEPCLTIHYTYNEILEGLRCCELPQSVQTHWILGWILEKGQVNFDPTGDRKTRCGYHFRAHTAISTLSNHSLYL